MLGVSFLSGEHSISVAMIRSIRIEGKTEEVSEAKSAEYFDSRPVGSRIGAAVSVRQSEVVASREVLTVSQN